MLPDLSGLELQVRLAAQKCELPIIFLTGCQDVSLTVQAMKAGALEFLTLPFCPDLVLNAVGSALQLSRAALLRHSQLETLHARFSLLTPREREVMERVVCGRMNKQVGGDLGISEIPPRRTEAKSCARCERHRLLSWRGCTRRWSSRSIGECQRQTGRR